MGSGGYQRLLENTEDADHERRKKGIVQSPEVDRSKPDKIKVIRHDDNFTVSQYRE